MWKIKHIFDGEYGCEELAEGQRPKVSVTLINEKEEEEKNPMLYKMYGKLKSVSFKRKEK